MTNAIAVAVAPGSGRIARRSQVLLFDPSGDNNELIASFDSASDDDAAIIAVKQHLIDAEFQVSPIVVIDWRADGLGLLVFGDADVHSSAPAAPMISGAGSGTWIERQLGALELGDANEAQVWCGDDTDEATNLRLGVVRAGGVRVSVVREPVPTEIPPAASDDANPRPVPSAHTNGVAPAEPAVPAPAPAPADSASPAPSSPPAASSAADSAPPAPPSTSASSSSSPDSTPPAPPSASALSSSAAPPPPPAPLAPPSASASSSSSPDSAPAAPSPPAPVAAAAGLTGPDSTSAASASAASATASPASSQPGYVAEPAELDWTDTEPKPDQSAPPAPPAAPPVVGAATADPFSGEAPPAPVVDTASESLEDSITESAGPIEGLDEAVAKGAGLVEASMCVNGHSNPPRTMICRDCAVEMDPDAEVSLVAQPSVGHLRFAGGNVVEIDKALVIGRKPAAEPPATHPVLVDHAEVSRSHVQVSIEGWAVLATDLGSRNGTWVIPPNDPAPVKLEASVPYLLEHGTTVHLGGPEASFTYDFGTD